MSSYGYGSSAYGDESDGSHGYGGSYRSYPNAALYLDGPGSSYSIERAYSSSYAYETQAGGIFTQRVAHTSAGYMSDTSYRISDGSYSLIQSFSYENFQERSGASYGYGPSHGYYTSYGPPSVYAENTFSQTQNVVGGTTYFNTTGSSSTATTTGYVYASYTHQTSEAVAGHPVTGAGHAYFASSVTDPYGYSTYSSQASTF